MKKSLLFLLLITGFSQAQIVDIPDTNFKAKLISLGKDLNGDGEIQVSEAEAVIVMNIGNSNISSLEGIQSFVNLESLSCYNNNLGSLELSGLTNLSSLTCNDNPSLTSLDVSGCIALYSCNANNCALTNLDASGLSELRSLNVSGNQLAALNLSGCVKLQTLLAKNNLLTSLDASDVGLIFTATMFDVSYNLLTSLTVADGANFMYFYCNYNLLTTLDVSGISCEELFANHNSLQSIQLPSGNSGLLTVNVAYNQLTLLDLSGIQFQYEGSLVDASFNSLTSVNLNNVSKLGTLRLRDNLLESIDLSHCRELQMAELSLNPNLQSIFAKNGKNEDFFLGGDNNLIFVCADEIQLEQGLQAHLTEFYGFQNAVASAYCFFQPGGNFNTITGDITFDADNNGCDSTDPDQPYVKLTLTSGNNNYAVFTSPDGTYSNFGQTGTFNVGVAMENASLFTITPPLATIIFGNNSNNITTQDFCITANGIQNDLETVIVPLSPARPGFDATYKIIYKNKGNQVLSGNVDFNYQENELDFVNASIVPDAQSSGVLSWNFSNLYPFESRSIDVRLNVNSPMETPAVNIGDQLSFEVQANPIAGDVTSGDNGFSIKQIVIGSFDPNDITCLEGEHVNPTEIGKYLHYNINFENTGTAAAENIVVKDMIDLTKYDISSLQILNASHPVTTRITNDKVEFIFEWINLGASEHGNVTFKIKTKSTLVTGNSVSQKADIYFDYNFPVETNVAMTTFDTLGTNEIIDSNISIYPNPTNGVVNVKSDSEIKTISLFDIQGRKLMEQSNVNNIDISNYMSGVYFIRVATDNGFKSQKLIKQ